MRLFVSVDLSEELADAVRRVQEPFRDRDGLRPTDPAQAHVTLKFLGDVPKSDLSDVEATLERAVASAGVAPFDATYEGLGVFPSLDYVSVVWLGVGEGSDDLTRLHEAVEREFVAAGFDPEDHEFTPHATLARMDHAGAKDHVQSVVTERSPTVGTARVDAVRLTESTLTDDGPVYTTVHEVELG